MKNLMKKENLMLLGGLALGFGLIYYYTKPKEVTTAPKSTEVAKQETTKADSETKSEFCGCGM
jgi:hypothetical protein